ncbi:NUDIX domain-containing protein [Arachidicoccus ginsenosidivorans]|nr:NUDIX domain-containing protein [Arachidicoccus ginsenosidivorans]
MEKVAKIAEKKAAQKQMSGEKQSKRKYSGKKLLLAVDCIIFGFDEQGLKLLVIKRGFEPCMGRLSLMGGFVGDTESSEDAAIRVLHELTGLEGIYMEQLHLFSSPLRDPGARTAVMAYFALIDIKSYQSQMSDDFQARWVPAEEVPKLIFDHNEMVEMAKERLRYKAALHPLLFELLPDKFTIPQLQILYEKLYDTKFDPGNFFKKIRSTGLLVRLKERDKLNSKKGAYFYQLDKEKYEEGFNTFLNFVYKPRFKNKVQKKSSVKK